MKINFNHKNSREMIKNPDLLLNISEQMQFLCVLSTLEVLRMYSDHIVKISNHFTSY